ncbi:MAG: arginine--tRNA ligase [Methylocapsa sp.]|nr:arginine--tRNA ligase [Methylocapsa sp.]
MNLYVEVHDLIAASLRRIAASGRLPKNLDFGRFVVEPPRDPAHGDLATNAAMVYAKAARPFFSSPRDLAAEIVSTLANAPTIAGAEAAGPGFINLRLRPAAFHRLLRAALEQGPDFGRPSPARTAQMKINVEYVSANPTGPMHVGHGRGAVFGDALANLLEFAGHRVTREYYINDAGAQVDVLARSAYLRYKEALGEGTGEIPEGLYPGVYLKRVGQKLAAEFGREFLGRPEAEWLEEVRAAAIVAMMEMIRADLSALNIEHEIFFSERSLTCGKEGDLVAKAIAELRSRGLVYEGRLPRPKGQLMEDWEDREQTLFRSTAFGDDSDRPLMKSDGSYTYFASDIAYHKAKIDRGYLLLIDVWGADHGGYVKRMQAAVEALSEGRTTLDVKLCQLVQLLRCGEPLKMSKRAGDFITLRDVIDEVGVDAVRFMMLFRKNDAPLEFDLGRVIEQSKDNPVFYVQYAHARARSVLRRAREVLPEVDLSPPFLMEADLNLLQDQGETALMKLIAQYPRVVEQAAQYDEPHRIAFYLHDLASSLHAHQTRGKERPQLRFLNEERRDLTIARLALVAAVAAVLASGLGILGVSAPEEMR